MNQETSNQEPTSFKPTEMGTTTISWKPPVVEARKKAMTGVMELLNFIFVERRQEDGSIKFHAHEDFSRFLQIEKDHLEKASRVAFMSGMEKATYDDSIVKLFAEEYYNINYNEAYNK